MYVYICVYEVCNIRLQTGKAKFEFEYCNFNYFGCSLKYRNSQSCS